MTRTTHVHSYHRTITHTQTEKYDAYENYRRALAKGTNTEAKQHPELTLTQAMNIAKEKLSEDPNHYERG